MAQDLVVSRLAGLGLRYAVRAIVWVTARGTTTAVVLGSSPFYLAMARLNTIDMTVSFFVGTTLASLARPSRRGRLEGDCCGSARSRRGARGPRKGLIGIRDSWCCVVIYLAVTAVGRLAARAVGQRHRVLPRDRPTVAILVARQNPDWFDFYIVESTSCASRRGPRSRGAVLVLVPVLLLGISPGPAFFRRFIALFRVRGVRGLRALAGEVYLGRGPDSWSCSFPPPTRSSSLRAAAVLHWPILGA